MELIKNSTAKKCGAIFKKNPKKFLTSLLGSGIIALQRKLGKGDFDYGKERYFRKGKGRK